MNRKIKNVIMITIILVVCVLSYFTMTGAVKSSRQNNGTFENDFGGTPPNFNNGEFSKEDMEERPSKDFQEGEMPNLENLPKNFEDGEIPNIEELPENFENGEMPNFDEMPENFEENFKNGNLSKGQFKQNISAIYYILFAVEGLIISVLLIYLIMSKFNSKTLKETLDTSKNIIVFIILVLIITIGLTAVQSVLANNVFATNNMPQFENRQRPNNNTNNSNNTIDTTDKDETNQI